MDQEALQHIVQQAGGYLMLLCVGLIALAGQWIKKHEKWDSRLPVVGMVLLGVLLFGIRYGWPLAATWDAVEVWLGRAVPFGVTIVGTASMIGHFLPKWFKTDSKPKEIP